MNTTKTGQDPTPAKRRLFRALAVTLSLLVCFLGLEIGLRGFGPKYHRFSNVSREYYSNPRGYFDVLRKEGGRVVYGIQVRQVDLPPGVFPSVAQSRGMLREFEKTPALRVMRRPKGQPPQGQTPRVGEELELWPTVRVPEGIRSPELLTAFFSRRNTILGLGDSFTIGQSVRYEDTYLRRLEKRLAEDGKPYGVKNVADFANNLPDIYKVYLAESARNHYPLVVYGFVLNDFGMTGSSEVIGMDYIDTNNGGYRYSRWRGACATLNFIAHSIDTIRLDRVTRRLYLQAFEGDNARRHFELLADMHRRIKGNGSELVIVLFPLLYEFDDYAFADIHDKIGDFCRSEGIPLLDLLPAFSKHDARELWVHPIDHHPNEIAHRIVAEELHAFLKAEELLEGIVVETEKLSP